MVASMWMAAMKVAADRQEAQGGRKAIEPVPIAATGLEHAGNGSASEPDGRTVLVVALRFYHHESPPSLGLGGLFLCPT